MRWILKLFIRRRGFVVLRNGMTCYWRSRTS